MTRKDILEVVGNTVGLTLFFAIGYFVMIAVFSL